MDYRKAFDLIDHSLLITKLKGYSINPCIINWICDFLMNRQQRVKMENDIYSEWKDVVAGVPQGTKLGPWLFLVMISDLEISSADGNVIFVDDTTSFEIVGKDKSRLMQSMDDEASLWSNDNMFQIQPKKCKEMRISFKKIPGIYENITIHGKTIDIVRSVKILGVTLQSNLKWDEHINNIVKKASKRLYFLSQLKRAKVSSNELVNFYVTCIRSLLLYSCQVFHFNLPEFLNIMLKRIQKRAMNIIYGYDVPYSEALVMSKLHKLSDHRSYLCDDLFKKILLNPNDKLHGLLPYNISVIFSLRNKRDFTIPICKTDRFKNSLIIAAARRYNDYTSI